MRWRLIPATVLGLLGPLWLLGGVLGLVIVAYYNIRYGIIRPSPDNDEVLNQIALTPTNLAKLACVVFGGAAAMAGAWTWIRGKWCWAITLTFVFVLLNLFSAS